MNEKELAASQARVAEYFFQSDMRKRFYIELSKAGFEEEQIRVIRDIVLNTCMHCLRGDRWCRCSTDGGY